MQNPMVRINWYVMEFEEIFKNHFFHIHQLKDFVAWPLDLLWKLFIFDTWICFSFVKQLQNCIKMEWLLKDLSIIILSWCFCAECTTLKCATISRQWVLQINSFIHFHQQSSLLSSFGHTTPSDLLYSNSVANFGCSSKYELLLLLVNH